MNFKKTVLLFGVMISVLLTSFTGATADFTDVTPENSALSEAVSVLTEKGITKGISDTEFGTEEKVTRAQMAAFLYRMANDGKSLEGGENETPFKDLDDPTFYAMISWANKEGIIKGISDTEFNPNGSISLRDCYAMLVRMLGYEEKLPVSYPDGYITIAENIGLSQNINKESTDTLTRGDVAIILNNTLNKKTNVLDGKKILFTGNSYSYYGNMVPTRHWDIKREEDAILSRFNDVGYFYQLCRQNGAIVTVDNWAYSSHSLRDLFGGGCFDKNRHPGYNHLEDLKKHSDMNYDYVVIQAPTALSTLVDESCLHGYVCNIFREVNPDVKIIYTIPPQAYINNPETSAALLEGINSIAKEHNLTVLDWGKLIADILSGEATVENSSFEYTKNTFIVSKSADDGHHPNWLPGYINTQMLYSLLTGEEAFGEDCSFCTDASLVPYLDPKIAPYFDLEYVLKTYYSYDNLSDPDSETKLKGAELTNFHEILKSKPEMEGIQKLIDKYIK